MKLINKKNKNYTQVFHLFTEEEWTKTSKNFNKNISTFFTGKKHEVFVNAHEEGITYFIGSENLLCRILKFSRLP
jgi:leucyl aminopeptidase